MLLFANLLTATLGIYVLVGLLFTVPFVLRGANRIDPAAGGSTWGFRLIILPGVVALWPLLALRWLRGAGAGEGGAAQRGAS